VRITILGSGGGVPSDVRETTCVLIRDGDAALALDFGTGARRLLTDPRHLDGVEHVDVVLTHFHLDHLYTLSYLAMLPVRSAIWAPGEWLYGRSSAAILEPLLKPPIAPDDVTSCTVNELRAGEQEVGHFAVRASAQPRHWAPTAGIRVGDELALVTDTAYEATSAALAEGVKHLLHEAWCVSVPNVQPEHHSTGADAGRVAAEAGVGRLVLVHLDPRIADHTAVLADAAAVFENVVLAEDELVL
jgi:ribonuclease BN (tRNA processing enzyme)